MCVCGGVGVRYQSPYGAPRHYVIGLSECVVNKRYPLEAGVPGVKPALFGKLWELFTVFQSFLYKDEGFGSTVTLVLHFTRHQNIEIDI